MAMNNAGWNTRGEFAPSGQMKANRLDTTLRELFVIVVLAE